MTQKNKTIPPHKILNENQMTTLFRCYQILLELARDESDEAENTNYKIAIGNGHDTIASRREQVKK